MTLLGNNNCVMVGNFAETEKSDILLFNSCSSLCTDVPPPSGMLLKWGAGSGERGAGNGERGTGNGSKITSSQRYPP